MICGQRLRGICSRALRPVTLRAVNCVEMGSKVISPGDGPRDKGQEQLRGPICLSPSNSEYGYSHPSRSTFTGAVEDGVPWLRGLVQLWLDLEA